MTTFPNATCEYKYNPEKDKEFSPFGDYVGVQDIIINGVMLQEGDHILVKDSSASEWQLAKYTYTIGYEVYAYIDTISNNQSWRYVDVYV